MKTPLQLPRVVSFILSAASILFWSALPASAQESSAPRVELLTMNGSKPNLSAAGEGITSYKIGDLYKRGSTRITLVQASDARFKIELPVGYSVFNNLIYSVDTDAVFTGPTDVTFHVPSAPNREIFNKLRILYAQHDLADPGVPRWIDATLAEDTVDRVGRWLSEAEIRQRSQDFTTRTLHAVTWGDEPLVMVVASVDPTKLRDKLTADLVLNGTATEQVTEGRSVTYDLKITNKGPDAATAISLHSTPSFTFKSVKSSTGKCSMAGQNVYCKFPILEKNGEIDIRLIEDCEWRPSSRGQLPADGKPIGIVSKMINVGANEQDPAPQDNKLRLSTEVFPDPNQGPIVEVLSPKLFEQFRGPNAAVPIRFRASDPDGFIKKLELFTYSLQPVPPKSLGEPTLRSDGEYELVYKDAPFGRNWVRIIATDNLDRVETVEAPEFFINGTSEVEIVSPKAGDKLYLADGEFTVRIHASNPSAPVKKVSLDGWISEATAIGNDEYVVKSKFCVRRCRLQASAIDSNGVETRSDYVQFTVAKPPTATLRWFDGEYSREFETGKPFKLSELILLPSAYYLDVDHDAKIVKLEVFVSGVRICMDDSAELGYGAECLWKPSPGKYKLQIVATDEDGAVGKSDEIEVLIERPVP